MERKKFIKYSGLAALSFVYGPHPVLSAKNRDNDKCKDAWEALCENKSGKEAFKYIGPVKGIPNVLIYGDSISIGYTPFVRKYTEGKATVFRIFRNGGSSSQFIENMEKQRKTMFRPYLKGGWDFEWDLIHFNVGLHDLKYMHEGKFDKINGKQVASLGEYKENINEICNYLIKQYPNTRLVFATTTPVPEGEKGRCAGDAAKYNHAAKEVLENFQEIAINDLFVYTKPHFDQWEIKPGNVHYNITGMEEQGKEVARVIVKKLYH